MNQRPATVLIADDHDLLRDMLARRLADEPDLDVIGAVADASAALTEVEKHQPDLVLMDIDMPGLSVFEAARRIKGQLPSTRVVFLGLRTGRFYRPGPRCSRERLSHQGTSPRGAACRYQEGPPRGHLLLARGGEPPRAGDGRRGTGPQASVPAGIADDT